MWNPFRSKLAASIVGGIENIYMQPGSKVLYLGAASGTTVSHVADLVGPVIKFNLYISLYVYIYIYHITYMYLLYIYIIFILTKIYFLYFRI